MGAGPSVTFVLVEATPYRLRYRMTATGQAGATTLPNAAGVSPDLRTDAATGCAGVEGLLRAVSLGVALAAEARRVLLGDVAAALVPLLPGGLHGRVRITPRNAAVGWAVDAAVGLGGSAGFPVLSVTPPANAAGTEVAYLDIHQAHTEIQSQ